MKRNDTVIRINLLGKEFLTPSAAEQSKAGKPTSFVVALLKRVVKQMHGKRT